MSERVQLDKSFNWSLWQIAQPRYCIRCLIQSFPVTHKVDNAGIFVQLSNENKLEVVTNGINVNANLHLP